MNISDLEDWITSHDNIDEIFIEDENGFLHDFTIGVQEEVFDGFETVYPECGKLMINDD